MKPTLSLTAAHQKCRSSGLQESARVVFQNVESLRRFGIPRTVEEFGKIVQDLPHEEQVLRRKWILQVTQVQAVSHVRSTWLECFGVDALCACARASKCNRLTWIFASLHRVFSLAPGTSCQPAKRELTARYFSAFNHHPYFIILGRRLICAQTLTGSAVYKSNTPTATGMIQVTDRLLRLVAGSARTCALDPLAMFLVAAL